MAQACPDGIDVYFENVGGPIGDAIYPLLVHGARVVICGGISHYNETEPPRVASHLAPILFTESEVKGFNIFSYGAHYEHARKRLARWLANGRLAFKEDIVEGLENAPLAFQRLFDGRNFGKLLVRSPRNEPRVERDRFCRTRDRPRPRPAASAAPSRARARGRATRRHRPKAGCRERQSNFYSCPWT